ncbi:UNVERIFIED_CONTAM: hypothetical protein HDU68_012053 [Siphonaria sp. JEL0065]|nr:hypothetical protein HDU68_012053 [Siphonaria sp. JEL0065]
MKQSTDLPVESAQHRFNPYEADWGFNHLVKLNQLVVPLDGTNHSLVEDDQALFIVHMRVMKDVTGYLWHNYINYDSKVATGFVGLKNQGATCYMNSLLQSLYFIPYFRKATYSIPTDTETPSKSIPLALQRIFYQLEHSQTPPGTIELTKSFGWDAADSFMQHDIQEFNRVLQDNLEAKMVGTRGEGAIRRLFVGEYKSYIKCMDVEFESSRAEEFYDVQLNVKGCRGVGESFKDYISVETLEGDNKYHAEGFGLQNAKKGVVFTSLPPVLFLQLKRFEYDIEKDSMVKINDRYEYPSELNLDAFLETQPATPQNYWLYGVLVHSGDLTGGHYCAFLRPNKTADKWYKFDDDRVTPCLHREVFEDNFGGESLVALKHAAQLQLQQPNITIPKPTKRFTNAYMLIYMRDEDSETIFAPLGNDDVQDHLRVRFEAERVEQEKIRKEKEEAHLFVTTKVLLEDHVSKHRGFDLCNFDNKAYPVTPVLTMRLKKEETLVGFKQLVVKELGDSVSVERLRVWTLVGRQNKTVRPDTLLTGADDLTTLEQIRQKLSNLCPELRLFVEIADAQEISIPGSPKADKSLSIFLKYYDPTTSIVRYAGKVFIPNNKVKITEILPTLWERAGLPSKTPLLLFEEVKPDMIDVLKIKQSFAHAELGDGDIICYQRDMTSFESQIEDKSIATIQQYFDTMHNRNTIVFKPRPNSERPSKFVQELELMMHKKMPYDDVVTKIGEKLDADPAKIQLYTSAGLMTRTPVRKGEKTNLQDIMNSGFYNQLMATSVLYYEVLDVEISELEKNRFVKISFVDRKMNEWGPIELLVPKNSHASDVIKKFKAQVTDLPIAHKTELRLYEVVSHKIQKFYAHGDTISSFGAHSMFYIEEVSPEDKLHKGDAHVNVFHFNQHPSRGHGIPFKFLLRKGEQFAITRERLLSRIQSSQSQEYASANNNSGKIKFLVVPSGFAKPTEIADTDVLADQNFGSYDYIGIDHVGRSGEKVVKDVNAGVGIKIKN